ncbi:hypothetical protein MUO83_07200, partial [Candidatus Bathyarchaeota archaeon]|nr:hypothetical protein [Candidatus Bathyarchaeota archaeon]
MGDAFVYGHAERRKACPHKGIRDGRQREAFQMYESLSAEAVRWGMPPYTKDRIEKWWLSNLQNLIPIVALHGDKIVGHAQIFTPAHTRRKGTADLAM